MRSDPRRRGRRHAHRRDSEVIEDALRRDLGLELLERIWERRGLDEDEALALAVEEQHKARRT